MAEREKGKGVDGSSYWRFLSRFGSGFLAWGGGYVFQLRMSVSSMGGGGKVVALCVISFPLFFASAGVVKVLAYGFRKAESGSLSGFRQLIGLELGRFFSFLTVF